MNKNLLLISMLPIALFGCTEKKDNLAQLPNPAPMREIAKNGTALESQLNILKSKDKDGIDTTVAEFKFGNKSLNFFTVQNGTKIVAQPNNPIVCVNGREYVRLSLWGINKNGFGYPFKEIKDDKPTEQIDAANKTHTYKRPYLDSNGKRAVATLQAKEIAPSKLKLSWDSGSPNDGVSLWAVFDNIRDLPVSFGGETWQYNTEDFLRKQKNFEFIKKVKGDIKILGASPTDNIKITFEGDSNGEVTDSFKSREWGDSFGLIYRNSSIAKHKSKQTGSLIIDFGECYRDPKATSLVGGLDFWELDATHVPLAPTKNIMPNPSFEQGLRYWVERRSDPWIPGQPPAFEISNDAFDGSKSLLLRRGCIVSFPLSLNNKQKYTLSFYAKSVGAKEVKVAIGNAAKDGSIGGYYSGDTGSKDANFKITNQWKRYSRTFTADSYGLKVFLYAQGALFDVIQIEQSPTLTDFTKAPLEGNLLTSAPANDISFGEPLNASFEICGKPSTKGKVKISAKNLFYENLYEKTFDVNLGADGKISIPLDFDEKKFGQGIFCVRADYTVNGLPTYTDYYRFNVMKKLSNTHATKNIFGTGLALDGHPRADMMARKMMEWGFGSTNWYDPISTPNYKDFEKRKQNTTDLFRKYKITNTLFSSHIEAPDRRGIVKGIFNMKRPDFWGYVSPEVFKMIEEDMKIQLAHYPKDMRMCYAPSNEEESGVSANFERYFKVQKFVRDLAKKLDPNLKVSPTHGTCAYNPKYTVGVNAINKYMELANKNGFKWDYITVHMYGSYDIDPNNDVDANISMLRNNMSKRGYGDETPIQISECGNICDVLIPLWHTRWYDHYNSGRLSYDFNNQEIFQASVLARLYLAALKYYPQLVSVNTWIYYPGFDAYLSPILFCKAVNTLGNLYSDVKFMSDIRPAAGMRAYVFKDNSKNAAIAALWCSEEDVVRSRAASPIISVKFTQPVKFYDFNGNLRAAPKADANGFVKIPLTFAPLSITADNPQKLISDLKSAKPLK